MVSAVGQILSDYFHKFLHSFCREFCVILTDDLNATTTACLTLLFIGHNDDPPVITYQSEGVASFTEGQVNFVPIINGTINITDPDHPRYRDNEVYLFSAREEETPNPTK